jgi:hypothetical protein
LANLGCIGMAAGSSRCGGVLLVEIKAGGDDPVSETGIASNIAALSVTCADILQLGLPLYYKRKVYYYYHRNVMIKAFYTLHYSHVTY